MHPVCPKDHHIVVSCVKNKTLKKDKTSPLINKKSKTKTLKIQKKTLQKNISINVSKQQKSIKKQIDGKRYNKTIKQTHEKRNKTLKNKCSVLNNDTNILSKNLSKKELEKYLILQSYSPTVNKMISMRSISPHDDIFEGKCKENEVYVSTNKNKGKNKDKGKCYKWSSKKVKNYLLDNLKSKKKINAKDLLGPHQKLSTCWFNTFFIIFFISDKGRKFTKSFREGMITGEIRTKSGKLNKVPTKIKYPLWLLNKFITATLLGKNDKTVFANKMNTNDVIVKIYNGMPKKYKKRFDSIKDKNEPGNPIYYYLDIISWLNMDNYEDQKYPVHYKVIFKWKDLNDLNNANKNPDSNIVEYIKQNKPHVLAIASSDLLENNGNTDKGVLATPMDMKKQKEYKIGNMVYKLDSVLIRDIEQNHFSGLLTLNGDEYMFDGENDKSPLMKKAWMKYFNKNKNFKITSSIPEKYNFGKGYSCSIYYRIK